MALRRSPKLRHRQPQTSRMARSPAQRLSQRPPSPTTCSRSCTALGRLMKMPPVRRGHRARVMAAPPSLRLLPTHHLSSLASACSVLSSGASGAPAQQQHAAALPPAALPAAAAANGGAPPGVAAAAPAAAPAAAAAAEEDDDDDLMITLDENATAIEPTAHRYQYTRPTAAAAAAPAALGGPPAVGAAPGQHLDTSDAAAPGAPAGAPRPGAGFGSQTAIGGVPRSAIPGLGGAIGGYQPAAIPGLGGAPTGPGGVPQPAVAAAAAVAAPTMRQSAFRAPQQSAQPRAGDALLQLGGAACWCKRCGGLLGQVSWCSFMWCTMLVLACGAAQPASAAAVAATAAAPVCAGSCGCRCCRQPLRSAATERGCRCFC